MTLDLHGTPSAELLAATIRLSADPEPRVREMACFMLGQQWREVDTPDLRDALAARLEDPDHDTRCEALLGLAYRRDPRAFEPLRAALSRPDDTLWALELQAAAALGDHRLHALVLRHQSGWDERDQQTADLARRLTDPAGPHAEDALDGVAELYRRRARGLPDGEALPAVHLLQGLLGYAPERTRDFFDSVVDRLTGDDLALAEFRTNSSFAQELRDYEESGGRERPPL